MIDKLLFEGTISFVISSFVHSQTGTNILIVGISVVAENATINSVEGNL